MPIQDKDTYYVVAQLSTVNLITEQPFMPHEATYYHSADEAQRIFNQQISKYPENTGAFGDIGLGAEQVQCNLPALFVLCKCSIDKEQEASMTRDTVGHLHGPINQDSIIDECLVGISPDACNQMPHMFSLAATDFVSDTTSLRNLLEPRLEGLYTMQQDILAQLSPEEQKQFDLGTSHLALEMLYGSYGTADILTQNGTYEVSGLLTQNPQSLNYPTNVVRNVIKEALHELGPSSLRAIPAIIGSCAVRLNTPLPGQDSIDVSDAIQRGLKNAAAYLNNKDGHGEASDTLRNLIDKVPQIAEETYESITNSEQDRDI